jgi:NADH-quinone oxidoreductase subunit G
MVYGLHTSEIPLDMKVRKHKAVDLGPMVVLDSERCVLCSRCIRFFDNVTGTGEMQFFGRGDHVEIGTIENRPLTNPYSGNVVDICPVGALTSRDFRFKCRVWFLLSTDSVCGGCSAGCNVRIDHRDGTIFRVIARRNVDVNKSWMCDEGRLSFHELQTGERVTLPVARGRDGMQAPVTWDQAIMAANTNLKSFAERYGASSIVGFASPSATNEALFLFKRYMEQSLGTRNLEFRLDSEDVNAMKAEDEILRRVDKHPNSIGAKNLGLYSEALGGIEGAIAAAKQGRLKAGVVVYLKPLVRRATDSEGEARVAELIRSLEYSVVLAAHKAPWLGDAGLVLPVAHWSEEEGTYTNHQGRPQPAYAAIAPEPEIMPIWQVMSMLLEAGGQPSVWTSPADVRSMMDAEK